MKLKLVLLTALSLLTPLTASAQEVCYSLGTAGEKVCYSGLFPANAIVIELGQPIRLPATVLKNLTNGTMNFTIEWAGIDIAGSGVIDARSIAAGESANLNDLSFEIEGLDLGTHKIAIGFGATGAYQISAERQFDLAVVIPGQLREIIQVPLRYCVVQGSPQALGRAPGEKVDGKKLLSVLREAVDTIWLPQAGILFRHGFAPQGIPVVADPDTSQSSFLVGDLTMTGFGLGEWADAVNSCEKAWEELYPGQRGIVVVNGRRLIPETVTTVGGVAPGAPYELWVQQAGETRTGKRGDALCGNPRNLLVSDITYMLKAATYDPALYKTIAYPSVTFEPAKVIAHELGHTLMLGHGNGLDDNADGLLPPTAGRRRFDQYCDANGQQEDINPPYSLMNSGDAKTITPLQREMARAAAKLVPGAVLPDPVADPAGSLLAAPGTCPADCDVPLTIKMTKIEMADTPGADITNFTHNVFEHAQGGTHSYWVYADLDNNNATGCSVSEPGRPEFLGAELRTRVTVNSTGADAAAAPTVWQCTAGAWTEVQDAGIHASAFALSSATDDGPVGNAGIVTIQMSNAVRGQSGTHVRVQAVAEGESKVDLLPASGTGGVISLIPPDLPTCSVSPMVAKPGQTVSITANRMPASRMADIFIADAKSGSASAAADGTLTIDVVVPATAEEGVRPVEVIVQNGAAGAACAMLIKGSAVTPATTATLTPASNFNGWNNSNVAVVLNAVDVPGGPGIASVSYSATGAQPIAPTTQAGASASMTINVEGQTAIAFYATNNNAVSEAAHSVTVSLDKTLPTIAYAGNQGSYSVLDTVNITCTASDSLSGLLFDTCVDISGPAYQFSLTGNTFSATAMDFASNLAMASTSFKLVVTYQDLCTLTRQFLNAGGGTPGQIEPLGTSLCAQLAAAEAAAVRGNANAKRTALAAYVKQLKGAVPVFLTPEQFKILSNLAGAL